MEIMEKVIDVLNADHDVDAMKACSQTCRTLLPRCRTHLFSKIDLDPACSRIPPLVDDDDDSDYSQTTFSGSTRRITLFLDLLDQTPEIAFYVRDLDLFIRQEDANCSRTIHALNMLSNLSSFSLRHDNVKYGQFALDWDEMSPNFISAVYHVISSPKLTQLKLSSVVNFPLSIFSLCGAIEDLSFGDIMWPEVGSAPPTMTPIPLKTLTCHDHGIVFVGETLIDDKNPILDLTRLQQLIASVRGENGDTFVNEILRASEALVRVELSGPSSIHSGVAKSIAYRSLNTIESFELSMVIPLDKLNAIPEIFTELEALSDAPNLREISISLNLQPQHRFPPGVLFALDKLLTGPGFRQLDRVEFHVSTYGPEGHQFREAMEKIFEEEFLGLSQSPLRNFRNSVTIQGSGLGLAGGDFDGDNVFVYIDRKSVV